MTRLIDEAKKHVKLAPAFRGKLLAATAKYSIEDQFEAMMAVLSGEIGISLMSRAIGLNSASINNWMLKILREGVRDKSITITRRKGKK